VSELEVTLPPYTPPFEGATYDPGNAGALKPEARAAWNAASREIEEAQAAQNLAAGCPELPYGPPKEPVIIDGHPLLAPASQEAYYATFAPSAAAQSRGMETSADGLVIPASCVDALLSLRYLVGAAAADEKRRGNLLPTHRGLALIAGHRPRRDISETEVARAREELSGLAVPALEEDQDNPVKVTLPLRVAMVALAAIDTMHQDHPAKAGSETVYDATLEGLEHWVRTHAGRLTQLAIASVHHSDMP
jgi:hypothetical protein